MEEIIEKINVKPVNISHEMKNSFLEYSISVIVSRALPDVRDGLKPVHRRIVFVMNDLGIYNDKPHKKCAKIVGDVMGRFHPHGDSAIYETMVRMAQKFSYRYMLVDGHGNFGSIDGDGAAAMRYTEARMSKISMELVRDINKNTVDFVDNYDGEEQEPTVLPARFPNLLVNGAEGIAVGMATKIPPHNLGEVIDGVIAVMEDEDITNTQLMDYVQGPDFPTGAYILGKSGIKQAYETGRGSIVIRSKTHIKELANGKKQIIITEIPYQVNKALLVEKIADLVKNKQIEGITGLKDESNREGIRVVIEIKRETNEELILNQLYRLSSLQTSFGVNALALVNNRPLQLDLKSILKNYLDHQIEVIVRKTQFDLNKSKDRAHILEGLMIALDNIDEVIHIIRSSYNDEEIITKFDERFNLTEKQSKAILTMQLRRLSGLEKDKIANEYNELLKTIEELEFILANHYKVLEIIKADLLAVKEKYGDKRRSEIIDSDLDLLDEDLILKEDVVISLSLNGYIKRIPIDTYRSQNRGGRGVKGMTLNNDDILDQITTMNTHDYLLVFTNFGKVYRIKGYQVPNAGRTAKGIPVVNLLSLDKNEKVKALLSSSVENDSKYLFFVTKNGLVKRTSMHEFESIRQNGKIAIGLKEDDELISVKLTSGEDEVIIAGANGKTVRFNEKDVRCMGRNASGVRGFNIDNSEVIGMCIKSEGDIILAISEKGYGKKTPVDEYRITNRGTKGVKTINITDKNGKLVAIKTIKGDEDILVISSNGIIIRTNVENISFQGRAAQGVRIINLDDDSTVSNVAIVDKEEIEDIIDTPSENI
ncbi:MAG: DNA gyrase subunit A [Erysipelotrichaceae bacterium]